MLAAFSTTVFVFTPKIYYLYIKKVETFGTKENGLTTSISIHRGGSRTRKSNAESTRLQSQLSVKDQQLTAKEEELSLLRKEVQALREEKKGWDATRAIDSPGEDQPTPDPPPTSSAPPPAISDATAGNIDSAATSTNGTEEGDEVAGIAPDDVIDSNPERALVDSNPEETGIRL
eukprot:TRINITY_DN3144_c0_g2_i9.p1 TRINITY_DN3144_c0_g2~~TRINITY_DN3144_c0_g2_i9.p1  ORF type:complete len:175 (-),score=39.76 TRINITY_DN3144_c0_g2_i9:314-838(-)